ncbi:hypothetical protein ACFL4N_04430 [Thermodesulfobacteriota bacterium]
MRKFALIMIMLFLLCPSFSKAAEFIGAPVAPQAEEIAKTESRLEVKSSLPHDEVLAFYRAALKGQKDIKFRNWKDATYIEDDGKRPWHSITISKMDKEGATVVIMKDNWTWIIGTLVLRYIGVFVVLLFLLLGMTVSGAIISRSVAKMEAKKA